MTPELALLLIALAACALLVVAYRLGFRHGEQAVVDDITALNNEHEHLIRDIDSANAALRECQGQMMRGAATMQVKVRNPHPNADPVLTVAILDGKGHAFTDSVLPRAASIYENAVAKRQIDSVTK